MSMTPNKEFLSNYEPIHEGFCKYCRAISGNSEDAKDLVQDSILTVLDGFHKIKEKASFKSYMFSVASNLNKMRRRRAKVKTDFTKREISQIQSLSGNQEAIVDFNLIYNQLLLLPTKTAEAMILFHISDLSLDDIRKIQGGTLSALKQRLKRGREKLLKQLTKPSQVRVAMLLISL